MALITKNVESGHSIPVMWNRPRESVMADAPSAMRGASTLAVTPCQRLSAPFRADYAVELGSDFQR